VKGEVSVNAVLLKFMNDPNRSSHTLRSFSLGQANWAFLHEHLSYWMRAAMETGIILGKVFSSDQAKPQRKLMVEGHHSEAFSATGGINPFFF
jgi:hypothetical protein